MLHTGTYALTVEQWQSLLDNFASDTKEKYFKRLPYETWKEVSSYKSVILSLTFTEPLQYRLPELRDYIITIHEITQGRTTCFCLNDGSFGDYVLNSYLIDVYEEDMETRTNKFYNSSSVSNAFVRVSASTDALSGSFKELSKSFNEIKENNDMKTLNVNLDFGACTDNNIRMSMYGLAVKNAAGTYVSYDPKTKNIIDVDIFNTDGKKFFYKIPVAISNIAVGDVIIHNRKPMFVTSVEGETGVTGVDVYDGEIKTILPATNMFGFNYITKIVNLFDFYGQSPSQDSPFGNLLPLMMMGDGDIDPRMFFLLNQNEAKIDFSNPMMMYFLMKDGGSSMLPFLMMSNLSEKKPCNCGEGCSCSDKKKSK